MQSFRCCLLLLCAMAGLRGRAQERPSTEGPFDRKNTWTVLAEYSNTSSEFVAGSARQRRLVTLGGAYTRRVVRFGGTELGYRVELRPLVFESDPVLNVTSTYSGAFAETFSSEVPTVGVCAAYSYTSTAPQPPPNPPETFSVVATCGRRWTFGQSFSPFGVRYALAYRHHVQPYMLGTLGYMYTSRPVPVATAESFNFVIDAGAGVEVFRAGRRSVSLEARAHHFSNRNTAQTNPGVDSVVYGVSYSFGR